MLLFKVKWIIGIYVYATCVIAQIPMSFARMRD